MRNLNMVESMEISRSVLGVSTLLKTIAKRYDYAVS
jgi:hypothetical protein